MPFWPISCEGEVCLKSFVQVTRAGVFIWENFHPSYRDLGGKTEASSVFHRNFNEGKSGEARSRQPSQPG